MMETKAKMTEVNCVTTEFTLKYFKGNIKLVTKSVLR